MTDESEKQDAAKQEQEQEEARREEFLRRYPGMADLVENDQYEVVYPKGVAKKVPRNQCRCPILDVGDFCPVHGG